MLFSDNGVNLVKPGVNYHDKLMLLALELPFSIITFQYGDTINIYIGYNLCCSNKGSVKEN